MTNKQTMDDACKRAWAKRDEAIRIIRLMMYDRQRALAFKERP